MQKKKIPKFFNGLEVRKTYLFDDVIHVYLIFYLTKMATFKVAAFSDNLSASSKYIASKKLFNFFFSRENAHAINLPITTTTSTAATTKKKNYPPSSLGGPGYFFFITCCLFCSRCFLNFCAFSSRSSRSNRLPFLPFHINRNSLNCALCVGK